MRLLKTVMCACPCGAFVLFLTIYVQFSAVNSFNLEVRIPLIKTGSKGTYFGYSVAEHKSTERGNVIPWILVGAPLGKNKQPNTTRSGALYKCPLTTLSYDCEQVITDGRRLANGLYSKSINDDTLYPPGNDELKEDQWLGVSVSSSSNDTKGGHIVVCAHRYALRPNPDSIWGQGLCYTLMQDFQPDEIWEPCRGKSVRGEHEEYGFCQAGTSSVLIGDSLMIGAPGPYTWTGTMFVMSTEEDFLSRDHEKYYGPLVTDRPVPKYSYLGMSVAGGKFISNNEISYAAGAPRAEGTGQVVIFKKTKNVNPMEVIYVIPGEQFGSSFGYEIARADINGDGWDDMIVGAPFYFSKEKGGAVYVFINNKGRFLENYSSRLLGPKYDSRFGFALAAVGDLNKDGCEDIAVGAPYEGSGAVYIFFGSRQGIQEKPSQVIHAGVGPMKYMLTFGYSLSGGLDMDNNGYPDLVVGAYASDAVALIRSRPIIDIFTELRSHHETKNVDTSKTGCRADPNSNYTCFSFETCAKIKGQTQDVKLLYHLVAETFQPTHKFSRVWFNNPNDVIRPSEVSSVVSLINGHHCAKHVLYLKENTRDILQPIKFKLNYTLQQNDPPIPRRGSPLPSIDLYPVLNQTHAELIFEATFQKDCGEDLECTSDLFLTSVSNLKNNELVMGENTDLTVHITVENKAEPAYEPWLYVVHPIGLDFVSSKVKQQAQVDCNVYNATVVACELANPFKFGSSVNIAMRFDPKNISADINSMDFFIFANSTSKELQKRPWNVLEIRIIRKANISLRGTAKPEQVYYGGIPRGEAVMKFREDVGSPVIHAFEVYNEGPWMSNDLIIEILWPHQVANNKEKGKWLLYVVDVPTFDSPEKGECEIDSSIINPLHLEQRFGAPEALMEQLLDPRNYSSNNWLNFNDNVRIKRRIWKRDTEMIVRPEAIIDSEGRKTEIVTMSCQNTRGAKCIKFVCRLRPLQARKQAVIRISARLWNATLVEDYAQKSQVNIISVAKVYSAESTQSYVATATTKAYPDLLEQIDSFVDLWIIIVSVIIGLLLLIGLIILLWRCGFFKRSRPDPTLSGNIEKQHREDSPFLADNK